VGNITVVDPVSYLPTLGGDLTLLAHNNIIINGAITNTGTVGSIAMYAGWDGVSTFTPAVNGLGIGSINVNQPISGSLFSGTATLTAAKDINVTSATVSSTGTSLTAAKGDINLFSAIVSSSGNVSLNAPVGTISVNNSKVDAQNTSTASLNAATISVVNSNGSNGIYAGAAENGGTIILTATNGITVDNSTISAQGGSGEAASVTLTAGGALNVINGSTIAANSNGDAAVTLNGAGGVAISGNSLVQALASNQAAVSIQATNPGAAISITDSEVSAKPSFSGNNVASVSMVADGALSMTGATIEAYSSAAAGVSMQAGGTLTAGAGASPMIEARGTTGATVSLLSTGGNVVIGGDILSDPAGGTGSISVNATLGAITTTGGILSVTTGGTSSISLIARDGIGTLANPIRIQDFSTLSGTVNNTGTTGDIALSFVSGGVTVGPLDDFLGLLNNNPNGTYFFRAETGDLSLGTAFTPNGAALLPGQSVLFKAPVGNVTLNSGGSILATGGGNVTLEAAALLTLSGPGTQVTGNNVTLIANDMSILGGVTGTTVTLAPFTVSRNINIESSPSGGVLSLTPGGIGNVSAGTLQIGRADGTGTLSVNAALEMGALGALTLFGGDINVSSNITKSSGADASLSLVAKNSIHLLSGADITSSSNKLNVVLNSDADASGAGRIELGSGTALTSNGGNVTLGGGADPATGFAVGDGAGGFARFGVILSGALIVADAGNVSIRGRGAPGTTGASGVRLDSSPVGTTTGSIAITGIGGAGALGGVNRGIDVLNTERRSIPSTERSRSPARAAARPVPMARRMDKTGES
jgi:hypothetical protein